MFFNSSTPISIRVASTNETIVRVPVQRSGYTVVRYDGHYYAVFGGPKVRPYITGRETDAMGRT
jgi:hypothetical protein